MSIINNNTNTTTAAINTNKRFSLAPVISPKATAINNNNNNPKVTNRGRFSLSNMDDMLNGPTLDQAFYEFASSKVKGNSKTDINKDKENNGYPILNKSAFRKVNNNINNNNNNNNKWDDDERMEILGTPRANKKGGSGKGNIMSVGLGVGKGRSSLGGAGVVVGSGRVGDKSFAEVGKGEKGAVAPSAEKSSNKTPLSVGNANNKTATPSYKPAGPTSFTQVITTKPVTSSGPVTPPPNKMVNNNNRGITNKTSSTKAPVLSPIKPVTPLIRKVNQVNINKTKSATSTLRLDVTSPRGSSIILGAQGHVKEKSKSFEESVSAKIATKEDKNVKVSSWAAKVGAEAAKINVETVEKLERRLGRAARMLKEKEQKEVEMVAKYEALQTEHTELIDSHTSLTQNYERVSRDLKSSKATTLAFADDVRRIDAIQKEEKAAAAKVQAETAEELYLVKLELDAYKVVTADTLAELAQFKEAAADNERRLFEELNAVDALYTSYKFAAESTVEELERELDLAQRQVLTDEDVQDFAEIVIANEELSSVNNELTEMVISQARQLHTAEFRQQSAEIASRLERKKHAQLVLMNDWYEKKVGRDGKRIEAYEQIYEELAVKAHLNNKVIARLEANNSQLSNDLAISNQNFDTVHDQLEVAHEKITGLEDDVDTCLKKLYEARDQVVELEGRNEAEKARADNAEQELLFSEGQLEHSQAQLETAKRVFTSAKDRARVAESNLDTLRATHFNILSRQIELEQHIERLEGDMDGMLPFLEKAGEWESALGEKDALLERAKEEIEVLREANTGAVDAVGRFLDAVLVDEENNAPVKEAVVVIPVIPTITITNHSSIDPYLEQIEDLINSNIKLENSLEWKTQIIKNLTHEADDLRRKLEQARRETSIVAENRNKLEKELEAALWAVRKAEEWVDSF